MGSRDRKRAERRKRKQRRATRSESATPGDGADTPQSSDGSAAEETPSERKNREAREALEPLGEGERPAVVTVAAVISGVITVLSLLGYALWDVLRDEERPDLIGVIALVGITGPMAWGLWKVRYWAVLGFQTVLVLVMISSAIALVGSFSLGLAIGNLLVLAVSGTLFYFMIKAWARIQMPERLPRQ
jgi:hypothetical protein